MSRKAWKVCLNVDREYSIPRVEVRIYASYDNGTQVRIMNIPVFLILPNFNKFSKLQDGYKYDTDRAAVEVESMTVLMNHI